MGAAGSSRLPSELGALGTAVRGLLGGSPRRPVPPQAVLLCLLDLLPVLERAQHRQQQQPRAPSRSDEVLQLLLTHMEAEHRLALRRLYARSLPAFVQR